MKYFFIWIKRISQIPSQKSKWALKSQVKSLNEQYLFSYLDTTLFCILLVDSFIKYVEKELNYIDLIRNLKIDKTNLKYLKSFFCFLSNSKLIILLLFISYSNVPNLEVNIKRCTIFF